MAKFIIGDKVKVVQASQGWGRVKRGDIGVIAHVNTDGSNYKKIINDSNAIYGGGE